MIYYKEKMYKTQLQELCHKRRWGLPKYSAMKDGPDHMPSFKASVLVNGATFTSFGALASLKEAHNQAAKHAFLNFSSDMDHFCKNQLRNNAPKNVQSSEDLPSNSRYKATVQVNVQSSESPAFINTEKEVEQAAAQLDLMSLPPYIFEKGDSDSFMTSLLILTESEGFCKPTYKTMQAGCPHMPTFFSTVEIEGVEFHGKGGRSTQQGEEDAAKIAYIALKECGLNMYGAFSSSQLGKKAVESIHNSDSEIVKCMQNLKLEDELLELYLNETSLADVIVSNEVHNPSFQESREEEIVNNRSSLSCEPSS